MAQKLSIALAQINPVVGDVIGNVALIREARAKAARLGAELVVFSELTICGYPPEDLVLKATFLDAVEGAALELAEDTADDGPAMLVGAPWRMGDHTYNAVLLLANGKISDIRFKYHLPNYGVFDESRVFCPGPLPAPIDFMGVRLGVLICEDMWFQDVAKSLANNGAEVLVIPNGSPFELDKAHIRLNRAMDRVSETGLPLIYVNQLGGQDELAFDGASFALDHKGAIAARLPAWESAVSLLTLTKDGEHWVPSGDVAPVAGREESVYQAMVWGLRDYVVKNRFPGVLLGLSGGIDSAIVAAVAVDALGADKVRCVMMPSPYTSQESLDDAQAVADMLGVRLDSISIEPGMAAFDGMLGELFAGQSPDTTEENIQSRLRGGLLMAISNKFGYMVVSTGNKSEMSTGYATLYGDMCGGYAPLKDVYKSMVFAVSRWRNDYFPAGALGPKGEVMPVNVIVKPPSAELKPDQKDQDTLPPYDVLDGILNCLIEGEMGVTETVAHGYDEALVRKVWRMLDRAEYKRRQAAPGVKITHRSFGRDRRYPLTNGFTRTI